MFKVYLYPGATVKLFYPVSAHTAPTNNIYILPTNSCKLEKSVWAPYLRPPGLHNDSLLGVN